MRISAAEMMIANVPFNVHWILWTFAFMILKCKEIAESSVFSKVPIIVRLYLGPMLLTMQSGGVEWYVKNKIVRNSQIYHSIAFGDRMTERERERACRSGQYCIQNMFELNVRTYPELFIRLLATLVMHNNELCTQCRTFQLNLTKLSVQYAYNLRHSDTNQT